MSHAHDEPPMTDDEQDTSLDVEQAVRGLMHERHHQRDVTDYLRERIDDLQHAFATPSSAEARIASALEWIATLMAHRLRIDTEPQTERLVADARGCAREALARIGDEE